MPGGTALITTIYEVELQTTTKLAFSSVNFFQTEINSGS